MRRVAIAPIVGILLAGLTSTVAATNAGTNACSSAAPCLSGINSAPAGSSGAGVKGMAINSYGVRGISTTSTAVLGQSASGTFMEPGVEGESTSTSGNVNDAGGGFGLSALSGGHAARLGVLAVGLEAGLEGENTSSSAASAGVIGDDETGLETGVLGESIATSASIQNDQGSAGVTGILEPYNNNIVGTGVYGQGSGPAQELFDSSQSFGGYFASNASSSSAAPYNANNVGLGAEGSSEAAVFYNTSDHETLNVANGFLLYGIASGGYFSLDDSGDLSLSGTLHASQVVTSKGTYARTRGASGTEKIAYGARTTAPSIEDVGEAQLVGGSAFVHLDPDLADVIDRRTNYFVFITPEGDSNQLYVTQKNATGFVVREAHGGRSTIAFQYRLVAKPFDENGRRLAAAPVEKPFVRPAASQRRARTLRVPSFIMPPDRALRASLGSQGYANLLAAKRKELARP